MEEHSEAFGPAEKALRQSWEAHRQAFGPILEPAFQENPQVRLILIAALNHISRREIKQGMDLLKQISEHCIYDEDKAAWTFFVGLCFEMAGAKKQMLKWYADAGKYHHHFYLPYLKLAKAAHEASQLDTAREYYMTAIECLLEMKDRDRDPVILGSAYSNLTSCLTMQHRYQEAEAVWQQARQYPQQPGAYATAAILYAAMGDVNRSEEYLTALKRQAPAAAAQIQETVRQILNGTHPEFREKST